MKFFKQPRLVGAIAALLIAVGVLSASLNSCSTLNALANLGRIQFKLSDVQHVQLCGIDITNKHSASDFSIMDGISLASAFGSGKFPLTFILDVAAKNPNPPSQSAALSAIKIIDFPWVLLLNGQPTISGDIGAPFGVPPGNATTNIPLSVTVDLKQFFGNQGYDQILKLALALSGNGGVSQVQLKAQPTMSTPLGNIKYPNQLTIVSTQFGS